MTFVSPPVTDNCSLQQRPFCSEKIAFVLELLPKPDTTRALKRSHNEHVKKYHRGVLLWHARCISLRGDTMQTEQAALQTCEGCEGFM